MAATRQILCGKCQRLLPETDVNSGLPSACPACGTGFQLDVFPAFFREHFTASGSETLLAEEEAGCFYHPRKKAAAVCDSCGRFLCGLCDVELNSQHLCPACIDAGRKKKKLPNLENERVVYDSLALLLALLPMLIWPITLLSAPATIYVVIRYWKAPGSLIRRSKVRFVFAFLIALAELSGWGLLFFYLYTRR